MDDKKDDKKVTQKDELGNIIEAHYKSLNAKLH
jgi:hypothetical protein